jgi:hypothetical protein
MSCSCTMALSVQRKAKAKGLKETTEPVKSMQQ